MIKEALQYIIDSAKTELINVEGRTYSTAKIHPVLEHTQEALKVSTLDAMIEYIKSDLDSLDYPVCIQIESPTSVKLRSHVLGEFAQRATFMEATPMIPSFPFGRFMNHEEFIIAMQSRFVSTPDTAAILQLVGNITEENVRNVGDDGTTQTVTARAGIAKRENVPVPNPVVLAPYRTFIEVEQPESRFVFRMRSSEEGPVMALFEADGGAWQIAAMRVIGNYFKENLPDQNVVILA